MWLVRTETNRVLRILGPFPKEKVCQMILDGELGPQDEVCEANHYWIYLHETDELVRQLGIQPPRSLLGMDETTETQTQTKTEPDLERTDPDLLAPPPAPSPEVAAPAAASPLGAHGEEAGPAKEGPDQTTMLQAGAAIQDPAPPVTQGGSPIDLTAAPAPVLGAAANPVNRAAGPTVVYRPMVLGDIQRPSAWRAILLVLLAVAAAAIVLILGILKK